MTQCLGAVMSSCMSVGTVLNTAGLSHAGGATHPAAVHDQAKTEGKARARE